MVAVNNPTTLWGQGWGNKPKHRAGKPLAKACYSERRSWDVNPELRHVAAQASFWTPYQLG